MRFSSIATLLTLASAAQAQEYATQLLAALQGAGLTSLADAITSVANTTEGMALVSALPMGNLTILAPTNGAFAGVPANVSSNTTLLTQVLAYHVLNGTYNPADLAMAPMHTIGRSALMGDEYARLPNGRSQALVLSQNSNGTGTGNDTDNMNSLDNGNVTSSINIFSNLRNVTSDGTPITFQNLLVVPIGEVINLPPNLSALATQAAPQIAGLITNAGLIGPLESLRGLTIFVPSDAAVTSVADAVGQLNETQVATVLGNHVINNTVAYSTTLSNSTQAVSLSGASFTFAINSTGVFVTSGDVTARVIQSDIVLANGVAHVIDRVLVNTQANPTAVQSANSVAATATQTMTEDAGVGASTPSATTSGSPASTVAASSGGFRLEASVGATFLGALVAFMV